MPLIKIFACARLNKSQEAQVFKVLKVLRHSYEKQETPKTSKDVGTPRKRNFEELQGTLRKLEELQGTPRNSEKGNSEELDT